MTTKPVAVVTDGNAFAIIGAARRAMIKAKYEPEVIKKYIEMATSGDYDHLLRITMTYVELEVVA